MNNGTEENTNLLNKKTITNNIKPNIIQNINQNHQQVNTFGYHPCWDISMIWDIDRISRHIKQYVQSHALFQWIIYDQHLWVTSH